MDVFFLFFTFLHSASAHLFSFSFPLHQQHQPQAELSSLAELTGELRAARTRSEARLRLERRRLMELKSVIEEIDDDDEGGDDGDDREGGNGGDPFNDADTVAGRSSGVFSDPALEDL